MICKKKKKLVVYQTFARQWERFNAENTRQRKAL